MFSTLHYLPCCLYILSQKLSIVVIAYIFPELHFTHCNLKHYQFDFKVVNSLNKNGKHVITMKVHSLHSDIILKILFKSRLKQEGLYEKIIWVIFTSIYSYQCSMLLNIVIEIQQQKTGFHSIEWC